MDRPKRTNYQGQQTHSTASKYPGGPNPRYKGNRPMSSNPVYDAFQAASRRLRRFTNLDVFFMSILAGAFFTVGTLLSVILSNEIANPVSQTLLASLGLTVGMLFVILTNSVLFTEGNIYVPANFDNLSIFQASLRLFRFWGITWAGNFIGAFLLAFCVYLSQEYSTTLQQTFVAITTNKMAYSNGTLRSTGELIVSGMLANWFIVTATYFAVASRNLINQFVILFLVFALIIAANFQYFPANLGYFLLSAFHGNRSGLVDAIFLNLIPVSLGNIFGATILASGTMLFLIRKRTDKPLQ